MLSAERGCDRKGRGHALARAAVSHHHTLPDLPTLRDAFLRFPGTPLFHFQWLEKYAPPVLLRQV
jgi:hypothetical protein